MTNDYFFFGDKIPEADKDAVNFAELVCEVVRTRKALRKAKSKVPEYTAQWGDEDYYLNEQHAYNVAAKNLYDAVKALKA